MTLKEKEKKIKELGDRIVLHQGVVPSREQARDMNDEEERMTFRLKELVEESERRSKDLLEEIKNKEADIKLVSLQKIIDILNEKA